MSIIRFTRIDPVEYPRDCLIVEVLPDGSVFMQCHEDDSTAWLMLSNAERRLVRRALRRPKRLDPLYIDQDELDRIAATKETV